MLRGLRRALALRAARLAIRYARHSIESGEQGEEARAMWQKLVKFMDGKKTYTGFILLAWPGIVSAASMAAQQVGLSPHAMTLIVWLGGGTVMVVLGGAHKLVKYLDNLTPDDARDIPYDLP